MTIAVALVKLKLLEDTMVMREDEIDCPGDTITYRCSIESNTEELHLLWSVTFPNDHMPFEWVYDCNSTIGVMDDLEMSISASLLDCRIVDGYIESTLTLTVLGLDVNMNGMVVECSIGDLDDKNVTVLINISGTLTKIN